jgi:hypothetical protein
MPSSVRWWRGSWSSAGPRRRSAAGRGDAQVSNLLDLAAGFSGHCGGVRRGPRRSGCSPPPSGCAVRTVAAAQQPQRRRFRHGLDPCGIDVVRDDDDQSAVRSSRAARAVRLRQRRQDPGPDGTKSRLTSSQVSSASAVYAWCGRTSPSCTCAMCPLPQTSTGTPSDIPPPAASSSATSFSRTHGTAAGRRRRQWREGADGTAIASVGGGPQHPASNDRHRLTQCARCVETVSPPLLPLCLQTTVWRDERHPSTRVWVLGAIAAARCAPRQGGRTMLDGSIRTQNSTAGPSP